VDINITFSNDIDIGLEFNNSIELTDMFDITTAVGGKYPEYTGATEIIPTVEDQVLATEKKSLESDITVKKVPTYETSNPSGGYTFTILS